MTSIVPPEPSEPVGPDSITNRKTNGVIEVQEIDVPEKPSLLVLIEDGQDEILSIVADVLGQPCCLVSSCDTVQQEPYHTVLGLHSKLVAADVRSLAPSRTVIHTHCVDNPVESDPALSQICDYEYLYSMTPYLRRDVARFLGFILGQIGHHRDLTKKKRTTLISTTFPDVHAALPNLDILSVGADAVELRVDLLKEPLPDGTFRDVPSLKFVGEQLMTLRQRTELPIIYTTRCTKENGRFPMDEPNLFLTYLYRAIQWGCEYIDVELWLPEDIRRTLSERKGNSKIISAFHDFSGTFRWTAPEAEELFRHGAVYGDVVKMIALTNTVQENYELEYFRSTIQSRYPHPPLSALNMGSTGQLSRTLNKVFTPITHPLLPMIAAPGQLSAAEINAALHTMGQLPRRDIYGIVSARAATRAVFFEKCFNELGLPHVFTFVERGPITRHAVNISSVVHRPLFGGAYLNPPLAVSHASYLPQLSPAARAIGQVDTVVLSKTLLATTSLAVGQPGMEGSSFVGDNCTWKGIRATLTHDFVPSAYRGRAALLLASDESSATPAIFALKSLAIGPIYTVGFTIKATQTQGQEVLGVGLGAGLQPVRSVEDVKRLERPFAIISALPGDKGALVAPLLRHYGPVKTDESSRGTAGKVFVDLVGGTGSRRERDKDPVAVAASLGWSAYGVADVAAWTTVETLRLLVGQNVPFDFAIEQVPHIKGIISCRQGC
ncbi:aldolase [Eremomyces bilateralis CBS 781.70]|uniref:Aldolase n=1 Tax=Eremomyces bilateralis CBS 781.70 TaxID=1392243 RepID=A0A6G1FX75_9PEZI|nr:aldolase [Eremomyces bilateralis CBS 781.70]KAF1810291.1 aldolase [Eremomyces bilateralis CBS 781.70]